MAAPETQPPAPFGDYYREIYAKGMLAGERPTLPMAWADLEAAAEEKLDDRAIAYIFGGAGSEDTMRANLEACRRWRIVPRVLARDLSVRDLSTEVLGTRMPRPCCSRRSGCRPCSIPTASLPPRGPRPRWACR